MRRAALIALALGACARPQAPPPETGETVPPRIAVALRLEDAPEGASGAGPDMPAVAFRGERDLIVTATPLDEMTGLGHPSERARVLIAPADAELDPITPDPCCRADRDCSRDGL